MLFLKLIVRLLDIQEAANRAGQKLVNGEKLSGWMTRRSPVATLPRLVNYVLRFRDGSWLDLTQISVIYFTITDYILELTIVALVPLVCLFR